MELGVCVSGTVSVGVGDSVGVAVGVGDGVGAGDGVGVGAAVDSGVVVGAVVAAGVEVQAASTRITPMAPKTTNRDSFIGGRPPSPPASRRAPSSLNT